ncbi:hypothetical protein OnM2_073037 [Erysiphe neolycopersici]|uniref:Uncharacterized protein n=1 Tax=Erysiphe neolycopersici TaxID=212602 RepID=A0A420HJE3_9PEZI|nr:hypothetical protein OnM2_073037 [Erysiphe neolycopersici]
MSLARALTVIRSRKSSDPASSSSARSLTSKRSFAHSSMRPKISAPMELISTTNMISYNAPDISLSTTTSSSVSDLVDLDRSPTGSRSSFTSTDSSSEESGVQPNHLSCYFGSPASYEKAPSIPSRAPSHVKSNNSVETFLARKQSKNFNFSSQKTKSMARSSIIMFSPEIETLAHIDSSQMSYSSFEYDQCHKKSHPSVILETEGFVRFGAEEYIDDINEIYQLIFGADPYSLSKMRV